MKIFLRTTLLVLFAMIAARGAGQINGGDNVFEFLNLSTSARITALGGHAIAVMDDDVNLAYANPALLNREMHQQITFNHNFHLSSVSHGYAGYGHFFPGLQTTFHAGVQYVGYGEFKETDELGQVLGTFKANDYAVTLGAGRQVDERLHLGANLKFITSQLAGYNSIGVAADVAAAYRDTAGQFLATIVFRNMGAQLTTFAEDNQEPFPFEIQLGISKRLRHLPFRLSVIYRYLDQWNITYDDPNTRETEFLFGEAPAGESDAAVFFDNLFRHFVFNGEFLFGEKENFRLRFGYNHLLRQELSVDNFGSLAGFSLGAGVKIKQFRLEYGHQVHHIAGGVNHLSISTNLQEFRR
jgi:hypothetical protein